MNSQWIVQFDPDLPGEEQMRRDREMAEQCAADGLPRLRLYTWKPWCLSLGHTQRVEEVDADAVARLGYDIVRRPTGGRAVLHAEELTYAVAMPTGERGVHETYGAITETIRAGLERLGARDLDFARSQPDFREHYTTLDSASCFSASALKELTWHGRKLLGSAQRRYGSVLLQHGSLLLDDAHLAIIDLLHPDISDERREALRTRLAERTATLRQVFGGLLPPLDSLVDSIASSFRLTPPNSEAAHLSSNHSSQASTSSNP